jgi:hypothetical protein
VCLLDYAVAGIRFVFWNSFVGAENFDPAAAFQAHSNYVMQTDGLIDGAQFVKAIRAAGADAQAEIDLGEGSNRYGHGRMIVKRKTQLRGEFLAGDSIAGAAHATE